MNQADFPLLNTTHLAWLDNAATSQKPQAVLTAMTDFYSTTNANVHRGIYRLSEQATAAYEAVREQTRQLIGAASTTEIIFTSGATAGLNLLANALSSYVLKPDDVILLTPAEHHSNLVPWQLQAARYGAKLEFLPMRTDTTLDLATLANRLHDRVKLVALAHIANATGTVHDIQTIIQQARQRSIPVVIDAAQSVPHRSINVQQLDCDFLVWSGHKMCGPTGTGVVYGKQAWLEQLPPWQGGGNMIRTVFLDHATWNDLPYKFEAGTPNIAGVIGLGAAIKYLQTLGFDQIQASTETVYHYLLDQLATLDFVQVLGPTDRTQRSSIASFVVPGVHPHDVAQILDQHNVAVRAGHHCAQPLLRQLAIPATTRASVYFYNTTADIDQLVIGLKQVYSTFHGYLSRTNSGAL
ncbi:MAG: SufS family cysteine desulfurase [Candidatus Kerfeldbacteria bacterium]|nr:SufS family cysteine desulfurase [Candidatus Kerfeldbacteria bacterium]